MKRRSFSPQWFAIILLISSLTLAACERPIPRDEQPQSTAAPTLPGVIPTQPAGNATPAEPYPAPGTGITATPGAAQPPSAEIPTATPLPSQPAGATPGTGAPTTHVVQPGETLFQIAQRYNVSVADIATANNIADVNSLAVGQSLVIPAAGSSAGAPTSAAPQTGERTHVVQPGENLFRIGLRYGFTVNELASYNNIADPNRIEVGQVILIPPSN